MESKKPSAFEISLDDFIKDEKRANRKKNPRNSRGKPKHRRRRRIRKNSYQNERRSRPNRGNNLVIHLGTHLI